MIEFENIKGEDHGYQQSKFLDGWSFYIIKKQNPTLLGHDIDSGYIKFTV